MNHTTTADDFYPQSETQSSNPQSTNPQSIDFDPSLHDPSLQRLLRAHLLALPYGAFLQVVAHLLERRDGLNVRPTGRQGFVGRNRAGGWDIEADLPEQGSLTSRMSQFHTDHRARYLVQVKQFDCLVVQQRTVDELRGCCLRAGAGRGLILTTSRFSPVAQAAAQGSALAPVTLIDGEMLLTLLLQHKMGVRQSPDGGWRIDSEFFRKLATAANKQLARNQADNNQAANYQPETEIETRASGRRSRQAKAVQRQSQPPNPSSLKHCPTKPPQTPVLHLSIVLGPIALGVGPDTGRGRKDNDREDNDKRR